ncbi:hypothetical protein Pfo_026856 [Paulownia fortunei]|nr:hypothetical protein Pfo_026856 [Paulownia fortunei]
MKFSHRQSRSSKQETTMKVRVVSRKLIKPCKPTPSHLRTYKISLLDQRNPPMNLIRILYYPYDSVQGKSICLEESLAQVLPLFYPLAGRYNKEKLHVDCNDEGGEYSVAEVDCQLNQLIGAGLKIEQLSDLLPLEVGAADEPTDPMLAVQINRFQCGGLAIGVCSSHRIIDTYSQTIFLKAWANAATDGGLVICPDFDSASYFPSENLPPLHHEMSRTNNTSSITRRFVFDKLAISKLRESLSTEWRSERPPSRVVMVSALLTQALLRADRAKHGKSRASVIRQAINVRERTVPPLSKYACGTWVFMSILESTPIESNALEYDFHGLASKMREANIKGIKDFARILSDREFGQWIFVDREFEAAQETNSPDLKVIWISDLSKFGDYELNFGFGKPIWVSLADAPAEDDFITLMNTKDNDGIEAWVYLHESDMSYLEQDDHLKMLTTQSG